MSGVNNSTNVDAIIGKSVEVVEEIPAKGKGRVKQGGDVWLAEDVVGKEHRVGEVLKIVKRNGVTVVVE